MVVSIIIGIFPYDVTIFELMNIHEQVAGDMLFGHNFDIAQVLDYFKLKVSVT